MSSLAAGPVRAVVVMRPGDVQRCLASYHAAVELAEAVRGDLERIESALASARAVPPRLAALNPDMLPGPAEAAVVMAAQASAAVARVQPAADELPARVSAAREQLAHTYVALAALPSRSIPAHLVSEVCDVAVSAHLFELVLRMGAPTVGTVRGEVRAADELLAQGTDTATVAAVLEALDAARSAAQVGLQLLGAISPEPGRREWITRILKGEGR